MENGNALRAFTTTLITDLAEISVVDYFPQPLPSVLDGRLQTAVERFMAADEGARDWFLQTVPDASRSLFGIYGHRAATLAARETSPAWLLTGLVGYVIANYTIPQGRHVEFGLAVYHHVARKIGENPVDLFEDAATYAGPEMARRLLAFGRRGDVTLRKYGWLETKTAAGVSYKFTYT